MKRTSKTIVWPLLALLVIVISGCTREEPGVEIPLNKIWAQNMPGTQNIEDLEPDHYGPAVRKLPDDEQVELLYTSFSRQISQALLHQKEKKQPIGPGFAVVGTGREALVAVKEIMEQDPILPQTFPAGTEVSLFFFTRNSERYVHLQEVRQSKQAVVISYRIIPQSDTGVVKRQLSKHFALIPLGKLPPGNYAVQLLRLPMERRYRKHNKAMSKELAEKLICKSFDFSIEPSVLESK